MLVLSRRLGEEVVIGGTIRLTIVATSGGRVRIGIAAPPSVAVNRKEVQDRHAERAESTRPVGQGPAGPLPCVNPQS